MPNFWGGANPPVFVANLDNGALTTEVFGQTLTNNNSVTADTGDFQQGDASGDFEQDTSQSMSIADANLNSVFPLKFGESNKEISVCAWVKWETLTGTTHTTVFDKYAAPSNKSFSLKSLDGVDIPIIQIGYNSGVSNENLAYSTAWITGRWYHICATFKDSDKSWRIRVWDDTAGALLAADSTGTATNNISIENTAVTIGASAAGTLHFADGRIDEVVVFNRILLVAEIDQIRNGTFGATARRQSPFFFGDRQRELEYKNGIYANREENQIYTPESGIFVPPAHMLPNNNMPQFNNSSIRRS